MYEYITECMAVLFRGAYNYIYIQMLFYSVTQYIIPMIQSLNPGIFFLCIDYSIIPGQKQNENHVFFSWLVLTY